jgi:O-antigen/teichoic acid export membrane protein
VIESSVTRSQVVLMVGYGVRLLLAFGITAVVGRATDPDAFGFFALVGTIFLLAHYLFDVGTAGVVVREIARHPDRERRLLEAMMGWRRLSGSALAAPLLVWALLEPHPQRRIVLLACAAALPLMASGALTPLFVVRQRQAALEVAKTLGQGFVLLGGAVFWVLGVAGPLYGLLLAARALLNVVSVRLLAIRELGYPPRAGLRGRGLGAFLRMAVVAAAALLVQAAYFHVDVFLVLALRGEAELGAYSAAFRPVNPLLTLPSLFMFPMLPLLSAGARADRRSYSAQVSGAATLLLGVGALAGAVGALLAPDALRVLYGDRYLGGDLDASVALRWMARATAAAHLAARAGRERGVQSRPASRVRLQRCRLHDGADWARGGVRVVPDGACEQRAADLRPRRAARRRSGRARRGAPLARGGIAMAAPRRCGAAGRRGVRRPLRAARHASLPPGPLGEVSGVRLEMTTAIMTFPVAEFARGELT